MVKLTFSGPPLIKSLIAPVGDGVLQSTVGVVLLSYILKPIAFPLDHPALSLISLIIFNNMKMI